MYIDHERRVVFFHVPKCAGEAISTALAGHPDNPPCSPDAPLAVLAPNGKHYVDGKRLPKEVCDEGKHISVARFLTKFPDCGDYAKVAVIRNVFDRVVSAWRYMDTVLDRCEPGELEDDELHIANLRRRILDDFTIPGERYIVRTSYEQMLFVDGRLMIDDVLLFEHLDEDFNRVVHKYGLKLFQPLGVANATKRLPWQRYHNDELTAAVREKLAFDLGLHERFEKNVELGSGLDFHSKSKSVHRNARS